MKTYLISYDLIGEKSGKDYGPLIAAIKSFENWCKPTASTWVVYTSLSAQEILNRLNPHTDGNDKLLVVRARADAWWKNLPADVSDWLQKKLD